ncbi:GNAT family N-acetyltransferase [Arenibacter sp. F26102]|uniref:GNAT family N-acetyltransferase n=1 Tax=Arenibacter sp. F26102 TaxID=2926416 RepID=UPI001FF2B455|nr:GNAT family N-acetyltransferase [Arenibacter sp. F26102]MCK0147067.1 GNAT family N-acetyltransferase [Arenibacter sp. F26102]
MKKQDRLHFGIDILDSEKVALFYSKLINQETDHIFHSAQYVDSAYLKNSLFLIDDVPNYLESEVVSNGADIKIKKINTYEGSLINLRNYGNLDSYLKQEISPQRRSALKRCQNRLDLCIKPEYQIYYGQITRAEYDSVFESYKRLLTRRLAQKESYWEELDYWEERYQITFDLINKKKACVLVIYNGKDPISIYINSICKNTLEIDVVTYDIDYSKFKLGFLALTKVIEWAIENKFDLIDMSKGDFYYKERFRNKVYTFQKHIIYDAKNMAILVKSNYLAFKLSLMYKLLPILKNWKINKFYRAYVYNRKKSLFKGYSNEYSVERDNSLEISLPEDAELIQLDNDKYSFLKKTFMDYLFLSFEYIHDVSIYKSQNGVESYFFIGKNKKEKVIVKRN